MSVSAARRWIFFAIVLTAPLPMAPMPGFDALVPPARYLLLGGVAGAYAITEGAAGPVGLLVLLFLAHAAVYLIAAWGAAWLVARLLSPLSPGSRRAVVLAVVLAMLFASLALDLYRTPFGRASTTNLWGVLS